MCVSGLSTDLTGLSGQWLSVSYRLGAGECQDPLRRHATSFLAAGIEFGMKLGGVGHDDIAGPNIAHHQALSASGKTQSHDHVDAGIDAVLIFFLGLFFLTDIPNPIGKPIQLEVREFFRRRCTDVLPVLDGECLLPPWVVLRQSACISPVWDRACPAERNHGQHGVGLDNACDAVPCQGICGTAELVQEMLDRRIVPKHLHS